MEAVATSNLAKASTSAEADKVDTKSMTVDLAAAAVRTPIDPTMKYDRFRLAAEEVAR